VKLSYAKSLKFVTQKFSVTNGGDSVVEGMRVLTPRLATIQHLRYII